MLETIYSLLFIEFLGILVFPIIFTVFWKLPDRGYSISKLLSLLLLVYIIWILGSFDFNYNLKISASVILICFGIISFITFYYNYNYILSFIKREYSLILLIDVIFVLVFAIWLFIRNLDPTIYHTEQVMDFTILNSVMNTSSYPPNDLWYSGNPINYYYYGYLIFGIFFEYLQIEVSLAYNLAIPLIASLSSIVLFGLIWNICTCFQISKLNITLVSICTVTVFNFFSNFQPILEFLNSIQILPKEFILWIAIDGLNYNTESISIFPNDHYWWWRATRVINTFDILSNASLDYTITEFPFFTFALADLHPHLISIPIYLMFLTLLFNYNILNNHNKIISQTKIISNNVFFLFISVTFGSLMITNTWNIPSIFLLLFGTAIIPVRNYFTYKTFFRFKIPLYVSIMSLLLFLPFYNNYVPPVNQIDVVGAISSRFIHIFIVWGFFICIILLFLTIVYRTKHHYFINGRLLNLSFSILPVIFMILIWSILIFVKDTFDGNLLFMIINKNISLLLILIIFLLLSHLLITKTEIPIINNQPYLTTNSSNGIYFIITILLIGVVLILIPEYFFIKDQFGNRMNTVFKFSFQSWILFTVFTPFLIYSISTYVRKYRIYYYISFLLISILYLYYSIAFINLQVNNWDKTPSINAHKNFSVHNKMTYDSIQWIQNNLPQGSIILEAPGDSYSNFSKISSFSGYPTVLGWIGHQRQWRPFELEEIFKREKDIENIYISNNINRVKELIKEYGIKYIYLGIQENIKYGEENISKNTFRLFGKRIYQSEEMINGTYIYIYDVN